MPGQKRGYEQVSVYQEDKTVTDWVPIVNINIDMEEREERKKAMRKRMDMKFMRTMAKRGLREEHPSSKVKLAAEIIRLDSIKDLLTDEQREQLANPEFFVKEESPEENAKRVPLFFKKVLRLTEKWQ